MQVLITGATGFVGSRIIQKLIPDERYTPLAAIRRQSAHVAESVGTVVVGELGLDTKWGEALRNVDIVIHTAARVHVMEKSDVESIVEFRKVNRDGTLNLARQAAAAGVKRFIFLSSIKVNGEETIVVSGISNHPSTASSAAQALARPLKGREKIKRADARGAGDSDPCLLYTSPSPRD